MKIKTILNNHIKDLAKKIDKKEELSRNINLLTLEKSNIEAYLQKLYLYDIKFNDCEFELKIGKLKYIININKKIKLIENNTIENYSEYEENLKNIKELDVFFKEIDKLLEYNKIAMELSKNKRNILNYKYKIKINKNYIECIKILKNLKKDDQIYMKKVYFYAEGWYKFSHISENYNDINIYFGDWDISLYSFLNYYLHGNITFHKNTLRKIKLEKLK